ncbi:unnamed protein product [Lampetra fluviatilis]
MEVPGSSTALGPSTADPSRPPGVPDAMPAIIAIVALFLVVAVLLILAVNFWPGTGGGGGAGGGEGEGMVPPGVTRGGGPCGGGGGGGGGARWLLCLYPLWTKRGPRGGLTGGGGTHCQAPDRHAGIEHVRLDNLGDEEEGEEGEELVEVVDAGREGRVQEEVTGQTLQTRTTTGSQQKPAAQKQQQQHQQQQHHHQQHISGDTAPRSRSRAGAAGVVTATAPVTVLELLQEEAVRGDVVSFCSALDSLLGGGFPTGAVTELCGAPGVGKTQICVQLAVAASVPEALGGLGGGAVYVDTEGGFMAQRAAQVALAAVRHCRLVAQRLGDEEALEAASSFTLEAVLSSIHCFRCHNHTELTALAHLLPDFLQRHPGVRLVVVDSVAFPFRHGFDDLSLRTRLLSGLAQQLIALACTHHLAVVLTNQMTTRVSGQGESVLVPALGESWGHAATHRLVLRWEGRTRICVAAPCPELFSR